MENQKLRVGVLGATGMVGQRFISLLENHPWFEVVCVAASPQSAGKTYEEAVAGRWAMKTPIPSAVRNLKLKAVEEDLEYIAKEVELVFSAIDADKDKIKSLEERYAAAGVAVVSNNSAHRWTEDVPMLIPEINADHLQLVDIQRKNRGWDKGLLVVKPNCSLQSYLPVIYALQKFGPKQVSVTTLQAISGAGKTFESWPEMVDNCIPFIKGEEEKTEKEPMKILGSIANGKLELAAEPKISATCIRVAASDGHMASVSVALEKKSSLQEIVDAIDNFENPLAGLDLPSAPKQFIKYFPEDDRPQTRLDRDYENGMGITCGRFRPVPEDGWKPGSETSVVLQSASQSEANRSSTTWKFVALSHNTVRGAAGGAVLIAELLYKKGYLNQ
jgi:aspartate-semialdehyde dehydrogenase